MIEVGQTAAETVATLEARAEHIRTPLGDGGFMQWRLWGEGPPLVLVHGGHGSWTHWIRNIPELLRSFRLILPDLPGYGSSDVPAGEMDADRLAGMVLSGLEAIVSRESEIGFAGFSFGGLMAGHVAALMPERVRRLVLVGAGGLALPRPPPPRLIKWDALNDEAERREAHRHNLRAVMLADPALADDVAVDIQAGNTRRARLRSRSVSLTDALRKRLEAVPLRLGGIWGERDPMTGEFVETRRALLQQLDPGAPFVVVPGAGHWVAYEAPAAVNAALVSFLGQPPTTDLRHPEEGRRPVSKDCTSDLACFETPARAGSSA